MPLRLVILACGAMASSICWADDKLVFDVYIAAGQSNMDGRGTTSELVGTLASFSGAQPDVLLHYTNPDESGTNVYQTGWTTLAPGYAVPPGYSNALPSPKFGPEISFGKTIADNTSGRQVAIIKVSRGNTSLANDWDPSDGINGDKGFMYEGLETTVPQALEALQDSGHSAEIRGMIWHQGEADGSSSQYQANLTEFIQTVRQDLGYPNLPFLIGELESFDGMRDRSIVRNAQVAVAGAMNFVRFVPSTDLSVQDDETHFATDGVIELGRRFAATMQTTISNLPGDFNRDGVVNQEDYQVWSIFEGSETDARADANSDGVVNDLDLQIWQAAVPEPPAGIMAALAVLLCGVYYGLQKYRGCEAVTSA